MNRPRNPRSGPGFAWMRSALAGAFAVALSLPQVAAADKVDDVGKKLLEYQNEARTLASGIQRPQRTTDQNKAARKLIDAQVAFGIGNFDDAAVMLYDYVEKYPSSRSYDEALYYLAESLFQKGDFVASRSYFTKLVSEVGPTSKFYQQGLQRLIELSMKLRDGTGVDEWLRALDSVPAGQQKASVPYVRGKYAYFAESYQEALEHFQRVPKTSEYWFQAQYFMGVCHIALGDIGAAGKIYSELVDAKPKRADDKRVVELSHMALGRLHYERDQPSKAIDRYLMISRRSDLFDEALYEVAWVYVKAKQFDKALRALELLALADPTSSKMPEVKVLEGNLRIRKAQGLIESGQGNSVEEYVKALRVFEGTRDTFRRPHDELARVIAENDDPRAFMAQITGRSSETFDTEATLPEVAAAWLREEPDVQRVVVVETDLAQIRDEIEEAEETIARLDHALSSPSRVNIFPSLAEKRMRATEILEGLFAARKTLAAEERRLALKYANPTEQARMAELERQRQDVEAKLAELPNAEVAYSDRVQRARDEFDELDKRAAEIRTVIDSTDATLIALEKYMKDQAGASGGPKPEEIPEIQARIDEQKKEIEGMRRELETVRRHMVLAKDQAGTGDEVAARARLLRDQLRAAQDAEHAYLLGITRRASGGDRSKADQIASLTATANAIILKLDEANQRIDQVVEYALEDVRTSLDEERAKLGAYRREFLTYEAESRELGGTILGESFRTVKDKFYDVLVRSEVGVIDVTWSQKEGADESVRRLELDKQRELRTLQEDFRDILTETRQPAGGNQ